MLENFVDQLGKELEIRDSIVNPDRDHYTIPFKDGIAVEASRSGNEIYSFRSNLEKPPQSPQNLYIELMEANLFGRGTMGASIGLNEEGNILTLSLEIDYNNSYKDWRNKLEDFVNVISFWKKEILNKD